MSILVIAEHYDNEITPGTACTIQAASELGDDIHILVAGQDCSGAADQASKFDSAKKVIHIEDPAYAHFIAENFAPLISRLAGDYSHILAPASFFGKNVMPRAAGLLEVQQISDITKVLSEDSFERPIYAGNAIATVKLNDSPKLITIRGTAFDPASAGNGGAEIVQGESTGDSGLTEFVGENLTESDRPELASAKTVISGGRGMGSGEAFSQLEDIADKLDAAVGASRAAVDAGYVPNDYQVGQTGKVVAPDLYIAVGISGAIQHLAGMKESKTIVAINNDPEAPIFSVADYGLVADLFEALPELKEKL